MLNGKLMITHDTINNESIAIEVDKLTDGNSIYKLLCLESLGSKIQIVVLQGIESFKEYYPVTYIDNSLDFMIMSLEKIKSSKLEP